MLHCFAPLLCYSFFYFPKWNKEGKRYNKVTISRPFWNAEYVDGFTDNTSVKVTWNSQQMNETNITTYTPWNITDCDSYSCYIVHDALTFIGEHIMHRVLSSTKMILCSNTTHTHTHITKYLHCYNIYKYNNYEYNKQLNFQEWLQICSPAPHQCTILPPPLPPQYNTRNTYCAWAISPSQGIQSLYTGKTNVTDSHTLYSTMQQNSLRGHMHQTCIHTKE